jgi:cytochrome c553
MLMRNVTQTVFVTLMLSLSKMLMADTIDTTGQAPYEQCGYCHEYDGNSKMPMYPRLAGQTPAYIVKQLQDFRAGRRQGQMQATAELLSDADIQVVAEYFSQQPIRVGQTASLSDTQAHQAEQLFLKGDSERGLVACASCHGASGQGSENIPRLAGQHADYLLDQLQSFHSGTRRNDEQGQMRAISRRLSAAEKQILAEFLSRLPSVSKAAMQPLRPAEQQEEKPVKTISNGISRGAGRGSHAKGTNRIDALDSIHIITCYNMSV